jgi:cytochrome o ubiquinol oxidase subunit 2
MRKEKKRDFLRVKQVVLSSVITIAIIALLVFVTDGRDIPVLDPKGLIASQERDLILITFALGLLVIVPVFIMLFSIAWKYRESNTKAPYEPDMEGHRGFEALWWGIPALIIIVLSIITAISTHALDPYKPIESNVQPVKIQVISMNWKWLFIYPEEGIATLNYMNIPEGTPVELSLTSDAPMNAFWVPALAGQVYSMAGMSTKLHLMADSVGSFNGVSSNMSGNGFADMRFKVNAMESADYKQWVSESFNAINTTLLTIDSYNQLARDHEDTDEKVFLLMEQDLYNEVIMKYMSSKESRIKTAIPAKVDH